MVRRQALSVTSVSLVQPSTEFDDVRTEPLPLRPMPTPPRCSADSRLSSYRSRLTERNRRDIVAGHSERRPVHNLTQHDGCSINNNNLIS